MKLFGNTKRSIDKTKNEKNVSILEVGEVVLVQLNLKLQFASSDPGVTS